jgi:hypothetical protein
VVETHGPRDSLQRELARERLKNARRSNTVRFWGVSAFFLLFLVLGGLLRMPAWSGNLPLFALYWLATTAIFLVSRRSERIVLASGMAVALFDAPIVFFLQWATFPTSNPSGVAGFTVGVYVLLVMLAAFSLQHWYVIFTAVVVVVYEVLLQHFAGVSVGAMVSTAILIGLAAARTRSTGCCGSSDASTDTSAPIGRPRRRADRPSGSRPWPISRASSPGPSIRPRWPSGRSTASSACSGPVPRSCSGAIPRRVIW